MLSDFVLVYEEDTDTVEKRAMSSDPKPKHVDKSALSQQQKADMWRNKFLNNLKKAGLETEEVRLL